MTQLDTGESVGSLLIALLGLLIIVPLLFALLATIGGAVGAVVTIGYNVILGAELAVVQGAQIGSIIGVLSGITGASAQ